jgi:hypothetical protein
LEPTAPEVIEWNINWVSQITNLNTFHYLL